MPAILGIDYQLDQSNTAAEVGGGSIPVGSIVAIARGYFTNTANAGFTPVGYTGNNTTEFKTWLADNHPNFELCDGSALNDPESPIWNDANRYLPKLTDDRFISGSTSAGSSGGTSNIQLSNTQLPSHNHNINEASSTSEAHRHNMNSGGDHHTHRFKQNATASNIFWYIASWGHANVITHNNPDMGSSQNNNLSHNHSAVGGGKHGHNNTGGLGSAGGNSSFSNTPVYLNAYYIVRTK